MRTLTLNIILAVNFCSLISGGCNEKTQVKMGMDSGITLDSGNEPQGDEDGGHQCEDPGDTDSDADTDADADADTDIDAGTPIPEDSGVDLDAGDDSDTDTETDTDTTTDTVPIDKCPDDMSLIAANPTIQLNKPFCIDRYEASRKDATSTSSGSDNSVARSTSGVLPWYENPITTQALGRFKNACSNAGKRICGREEWFGACTGEGLTDFAYGNEFEKETCNCVDTYCDDYCVDNGISTAQCNTASNCGYHCGYADQNVSCFKVARTGGFPLCTNDHNVYDLNGNLWEVVPSSIDARGYEVRGGAFNCAGPSTRLKCEFNAEWNTLNAGFRCCKDPVE
jgi:hypothetical protein